jgi:SAM-dependent methyltransferase
MKVLRCYNCGSEERAFYAEENGFSLVKCSACGLVYLQDRPGDKEIDQAHKQGKHTGLKELDVTGTFSEQKIATYLGVLADMFKAEPAVRAAWLDVGCGHGEFMVAVQQYSRGKIIARGTEPNIHKQSSAQKRGLNVGFFDLETHDGKYDFVSLLNVYSHLPDPPVFLELIKKLLNPGGELFLQTGDTAELSPVEHYRPFYLPDHLSFASETIVTDILKRLGFEVVSVRKYPFLPFRPTAIVKELAKFFLPRYQSRLRYYVNWKRYSKTDMFIRAKLLG